MDRIFVLFVSDNGFIGDGDCIVNNPTNARYFDSRKEADTYRTELYNSDRKEFKRNTISILKWM